MSRGPAWSFVRNEKTMRSKADRINQFRQMIAGLEKNYTPQQTILADGIPTLQPQIIAVLKAPIDAVDATTAADAAYHKAVADEGAANVAADATFLSVKEYLLLANKKTPDKLADYGLKPETRKKPSAATKAAAIEKMIATREARGTKGPKQRKAIKAPAAPAPAPAEPAPTPATPPTPAKQ
jgi:hypothetical protein